MTRDTNGRNHAQAGVRTGGQYTTEARGESAVSLAPDKDWGALHLQPGSRTPWGAADYVYDIAPGIAEVGTDSHGGIKLSPERNREVPAALRRSSGWYEEDCEAAIAMWAFPGEYAQHRAGRRRDGDDWVDQWADVDFVREDSADRVRRWFPDGWEAATGEAVTAEQSHVRAEQEFLAAHASDLVTVAATASAQHPGMVEVSATPGGRRPGFDETWAQAGERTFLVPREEYEAGRGKFGFVVDPTRHADITVEAPPRVPATRHTAVIPSASQRSATMTPAAANAFAKDLGQRWRDEDGRVRSLEQILTEDGVTGRTAWFENGSVRYALQDKQYEDSTGHTVYRVSKATFDALADIPDVRTPRDLARLDLQRAEHAYERARSGATSRSYGGDYLRERKAKAEAAGKKLAAARAAFEATKEDGQ